MHRVLGMLAATATLGATAVASADEITGPIHNIDLTRQTFSVGGKVFTALASNTVGAKLADLRAGDRVRVFCEANASEHQPWNAMVLRKSR